MEAQELEVDITAQGVGSAEQECGETAIAVASIGTETATVALATEQTPIPVPRTSPLPTMTGLWQLTLGWQPNEQQQAQFQQLYTLILAGNHQFNLTRITEPAEFWEKHLWDSLVGVKAFLPGEREQEAEVRLRRERSTGRSQELARVGLQHEHLALENQAAVMPNTKRQTPNPSLKVVDIGTGAGFPGIPVAIAQPTWAVTLLDSTRKKMTFLDQVLATMGLANATTLAERVEQVGQQKHQRQTYDLALVRAVATASVCAEYALPLLKSGGSAVLYRGQWTAGEMTTLEAAVAQLGGAIEAVEASTTPLTRSVRHCIVLKKVAPTPTTFPRAIGIPTQNPL